MATLDDIGAYLQSVGVGTLGTTLFKGRLPLDAPHILVQDAVQALIEVPGLPPERVHDGPVASIDQPMIQVVTRGQPHDYAEARTRAETAYLALDGLSNVTLSGTAYLWIRAQQPPFVLRQADEMGRPVIVFSVWCARAREATLPLAPQTAFVWSFVHQTTLTIPGTLHSLGTSALVWALYDVATPAALLEPAILTIHPTTFDVHLTFATPQSGRLILSSTAMPGYRFAFVAQTTVSIPGSVHGLGTPDLVPAFYDDGIPAAVIAPQHCTVHSTTYDVEVTFALPQSGSVVLYGAI